MTPWSLNCAETAYVQDCGDIWSRNQDRVPLKTLTRFPRQRHCVAIVHSESFIVPDERRSCGTNIAVAKRRALTQKKHTQCHEWTFYVGESDTAMWNCVDSQEVALRDSPKGCFIQEFRQMLNSDNSLPEPSQVWTF